MPTDSAFFFNSTFCLAEWTQSCNGIPTYSVIVSFWKPWQRNVPQWNMSRSFCLLQKKYSCHVIESYKDSTYKSRKLKQFVYALFTQTKKKALAITRKCLIFSVDQPGLEPGTSRLWVCCSNRLSYKSVGMLGHRESNPALQNQNLTC